MTQSQLTMPSSTRPVRQQLAALIRSLRPGQRIKITQQVRVGSTATWSAPVEGVFRHVNYLATGISTDRVPADDIVVVSVHFTKDNGELSSVTLDENSQIELVGKLAANPSAATRQGAIVMQIACPTCRRVLNYSGDCPSFCAYCGKPIPRPVSTVELGAEPPTLAPATPFPSVRRRRSVRPRT